MSTRSGNSPAVSILLQLINDYHAFNPGGVDVLPWPTAVDFGKQVSRGRPCVYRLQLGQEKRCHGGRKTPLTTEADRNCEGDTEEQIEAILSSPAFSWTKEDLCEKVKEEVEVAVTPDGRADSLYPFPSSPWGHSGNANQEASNLKRRDYEDSAIEDQQEQHPQPNQERDTADYEEVFVQPATMSMPLSTVLEKLTSTSSGDTGPVYYLQSQNSNLTTTPLSALHADVPANIPFAKPVLGDPEAVNIWMGNAMSVTSTHRDPYENLYLVLRGKKHFTLWAPCEELCLHAKKVRTAHHVYDTSTSPPSFKIVLDTPSYSSPPQSPSAGDSDNEHPDDGRIPWIPIDPLNLPPPGVLDSLYPYYKYSHPLSVTVSEGEILYLPSGWFHHVRQECGVWDNGDVAPCIAVNYWFDMDYEGEKYVMRELLGRLVEQARAEYQ